jgi:hypothetical protein
MLSWLGGGGDAFLKRIFFSNEATFHISGKVNSHNFQICGSENPYKVMEQERGTPTLNV